MGRHRSTKGKGRARPGVRIIGGQWRGQRIKVESELALRPTPDRVRETLFNWLAPTIVGSRCLDLFAGSGALGFEALSRGAAEVVFVERDAKVTRTLAEQSERFDKDRTAVVHADAGEWLTTSPTAFDVVFLDPPYEQALAPLLAQLASGWLRPQGLVYVERGSPAEMDRVEEWGSLYRRARAGNVHYGLLEST